MPESHSEPQKYQRGHVSPPHSPYIDMPSSLPWENWRGQLSLTCDLFAQFPRNKLSILEMTWQIMCALNICCASKEWHILFYVISQELCSRSPFRHTSRDNIARVHSQRTRQTRTCTPRHLLPSKLCLVRLGFREDFLQTFSCPLLSLYLK